MVEKIRMEWFGGLKKVKKWNGMVRMGGTNGGLYEVNVLKLFLIPWRRNHISF